jgi:hypothetical protein
LRMGPFTQLEPPDLTGETCSVQVVGETYGRYGPNCDQIECGARSSSVCESENCTNCPCESHTRECPACLKPYCASRDRMFQTCLVEHLQSGKCPGHILRIPLNKLGEALDSGEYPDLRRFVRHDSDGLGNPLPDEVCDNLGLAVVYLNHSLPDYDKATLRDSLRTRRLSRNERQRRRRAIERNGATADFRPAADPHRLAPYKRSTIHVVAGALAVRHWTGKWHYREQAEILKIMGLSKAEDFIRDRLDYLSKRNPRMFKVIESSTCTLEKQ